MTLELFMTVRALLMSDSYCVHLRLKGLLVSSSSTCESFLSSCKALVEYW